MSNSEWTIDVSANLSQELADSFKQGPIFDDQGRRLLTEELIAHLNGLKIEVFANEHPPPHFRVKYSGETANYKISDCSQLNGGLDKWYKNVKKWHQKNKQLLIDIWNRTRPTDCPVGEYRDEN